MKITNALHHHSIRRGIEVLRKHNFNLSALKRRPSLSSDSQTNNTSAPTQDPTLWTNHRVMEWLRSIDLSEYAANMRGSGVHGALIVSIGCNNLIKWCILKNMPQSIRLEFPAISNFLEFLVVRNLIMGMLLTSPIIQIYKTTSDYKPNRLFRRLISTCVLVIEISYQYNFRYSLCQIISINFKYLYIVYYLL